MQRRTRKSIPLPEFRFDSSRARNLAESLWGRGGTSALRTNRKGAYFFRCSAHGGYVVDHRALTREERLSIDRHVAPKNVSLLVQTRNDGEYVLAVDNPHTTRVRYRYDPSLGPVRWHPYPVYAFEEDCAWVILERLTDIRTKPETGNVGGSTHDPTP